MAGPLGEVREERAGIGSAVGTLLGSVQRHRPFLLERRSQRLASSPRIPISRRLPCPILLPNRFEDRVSFDYLEDD